MSSKDRERLYRYAQGVGGRDMKSYTVRVNAEYSTQVTASSADAAVAKANQTDLADWDQVAWSDAEAEED